MKKKGMPQPINNLNLQHKTYATANQEPKHTEHIINYNPEKYVA